MTAMDELGIHHFGGSDGRRGIHLPGIWLGASVQV